MIHNIKKRAKSDRGASEIISALFIIPLVIAILFTIIDAAMYFNNRSMVQGVARDGARSVAIMGGHGTATMATPIEKRYGISRESACSGLSDNPMVQNAFSSSSTPIECNVMQNLAKNKSLINVKVNSVKCDPSMTTSISQRTSCSVDWGYGSIPASGLLLIKLSDGKGLAGSNINVGTAESEVSLPEGSLTSRG